LIGFALVAAVLGAYWGAHASAVFAVERVEIEGASPPVAKEVRAVTKAVLGTSLLEVDAESIEAKIRALPSIAGVSVDRAFPNSLVVKVAAEEPVAVARRGRHAFLVTGSGKVIMEIEPGTERRYPRLWLARGSAVRVGGTLPGSLTPAARALAAAEQARLPRRVKAVRFESGRLTLVLRRGPELRLGGATDLLLKLTVATRVLPLVEAGTLYLDVSVPERPVAAEYLNSQVEG
jgi:cell division protein FtsQ